jgi:RHS repeat-associated protein
MAPDPRFGMLDPYPSSIVVKTPSSPGPQLTKTTTRTRTATFTNALAPTAISDTITVNGAEVSTINYSTSTGTPTVTYTSQMGRQLQQTLDSQGRVTQVSYPAPSPLLATNYTYGATGGRLSSVQTGTGTGARIWSTAYLPSRLANEISMLTDPVGNVTTFTGYDDAGRVTNVELPDYQPPTSNSNSTYALAYDYDGNMKTLDVPPDTTASVHGFAANGVDLLATYSPPTDSLSPSTTTYTYNPDRQIAQVTFPFSSGVSKNLTSNYDAYGRLTSKLDGATGNSWLYAYNNFDQLLSATYSSVIENSSTSLTNTYNGSLLQETAWGSPLNATVVWMHDNYFRVLSREVNSSTAYEATYTYDNDNFIMGTSTPVTFTIARSYANLDGRVTNTTLENITDATTYDGFGALATYQALYNNTTTLYSLTIPSTGGRDLNGRILSMTETIRGVPHTWTFTYDSNGQLLTAQRDSNTNTYTYDGNGNRVSLNGVTWTYDSQDRFKQTSSSSIVNTYTNDGTALSKAVSGTGTYDYSYDLLGNLGSVKLPTTSDSVQYTIDGLGRRVNRELVWGITYLSQSFVYDDQLHIGAELTTTTGAPPRSVFIYGTKPNVPDYMYMGGVAYRIISDWAGSVRLVVNASTGVVAQQIDYDEFGNVIPSTSFDNNCTAMPCLPTQPFGFAGGMQDPNSGLVRFGARDYDPQLGRWVSKDPIRFDGGQTDLYVYAGNDPVNSSDPDGKSPRGWCYAVCAASYSACILSGVDPRICGNYLGFCLDGCDDLYPPEPGPPPPNCSPD